MLKKYLAPGLMMLLLAGPRLLAEAPAVGQAQAAQAAQAQAEQRQVADQRQTAFPADDGSRIRQGQVAQAPAVVQAPAVAQAPAVGLRDGDTVDIRIANVPTEDMQEWDAAYTVDESGMLNLPFIGMVKAGGLPPSQVQLVIQNKLIADGIYTNPTVTVNPPSGMRFISVGGAVRAPGRIPYTSDLTLMSTISAAGGASDFAGDRIRLTRGGKVQFYSRKKLYKDPSQDPRIEPGDQIEIVESWW